LLQAFALTFLQKAVESPNNTANDKATFPALTTPRFMYTHITRPVGRILGLKKMPLAKQADCLPQCA